MQTRHYDEIQKYVQQIAEETRRKEKEERDAAANATMGEDPLQSLLSKALSAIQTTNPIASTMVPQQAFQGAQQIVAPTMPQAPPPGAVAGTPQRQNALANMLKQNPNAGAMGLNNGEGMMQMGAPSPQQASMSGGGGNDMLSALLAGALGSQPEQRETNAVEGPLSEFPRSIAEGVPAQYLQAEAAGNVPPGTFSRADIGSGQPMVTRFAGPQPLPSDPNARLQFAQQQMIDAAQRGNMGEAQAYEAMQNPLSAILERGMINDSQAAQNQAQLDEAKMRYSGDGGGAYGNSGRVALIQQSQQMAEQDARAFEQAMSAHYAPEEVQNAVRVGLKRSTTGGMTFDDKAAQDMLHTLRPDPMAAASKAMTALDQADRLGMDDTAKNFFKAQLDSALAPKASYGAGPNPESAGFITQMKRQKAAAMAPQMSAVSPMGMEMQEEISLPATPFGIVDAQGAPYQGAIRVNDVLAGPDGQPITITSDLVRRIQNGEVDISGYSYLGGQ